MDAGGYRSGVWTMRGPPNFRTEVRVWMLSKTRVWDGKRGYYEREEEGESVSAGADGIGELG